MSNETAKSPLHKAALEWAAAGFFVFPCLVGRKEPAYKGGHKNATQDPAQIDAWWTENPNYNVGVSPGPSGSTVLDVDPPLGAASLDAIVKEEGSDLPLTLTIRTPRGGLHHWFFGASTSSSSRLGPKLDTRAEGGYVLVPPSIVHKGQYTNNPDGGSYAYENHAELADLPVWVNRRLDMQKERHTAVADVVLDTPIAKQRALDLVRRYIERGDVAIEGQGGDDRTYQLCCELANLGLSPDGIAEVIEPWNAACHPPWDEDELAVKIENASKYAQNEPGAWAGQTSAETFAHYKGPDPGGDAQSVGQSSPYSELVPGEPKSDTKQSRFRPIQLSEARAMQEPRWVIPGLIQANSLACVFGPPKSFKTFLVLDIALGVAAGVETFGFKPEMRQVLYSIGEGQWNIAHSHAPAWQLARQVEAVPNFWLVTAVPKILQMNPNQTEELIKEIEKAGVAPELVIIDTVARSISGLDENSAKDLGLFVEACDDIRRKLKCTVVAIHHTGKDVARGTRGGNKIEADFDTIIEVSRHEKSPYVAVRVKEQRNAPEREDPFYFEARRMGPSLAFYQMEASAFTEATVSTSPISRKNVAAALVRLNARGAAAASTLAFLASNLAVHHDSDATLIEKALKKGARAAPLNAYCDETGLRWYIPNV